MKLVKLFIMLAIAVFLAACAQNSASSAYTGDNYGNYKCYAHNGSFTATGWASNRSDAEANALDKCKEHSGGVCSISNCEEG